MGERKVWRSQRASGKANSISARETAAPVLTHAIRTPQDDRRRRCSQHRQCQYKGHACLRAEETKERQSEDRPPAWLSANLRRLRRHRPSTGPRASARSHNRKEAFGGDIEYANHHEVVQQQYHHKDAEEGSLALPVQSRSLRQRHVFPRTSARRSISRSKPTSSRQHHLECHQRRIEDERCSLSNEIEAEAQFDGGTDAHASQAWAGIKSNGLHSVNVADRVRAFETKAKQHDTTKVGTTTTDAPLRRRDIVMDEPAPLVFPLHVRRFTRRSGRGGHLRPDTPLYRSNPADDAELHAPLPQRTIPMVKAPPDQSPVPTQSDVDSVEEWCQAQDYTKANSISSRAPFALGQYQINSPILPGFAQATTRVGPFTHLHGRRDSCVRHGRKPGSNRNVQDAYVEGGGEMSIGSDDRAHVESMGPATSRYSTRNHNNDDTCPDCLAELGIRKRETAPAYQSHSPKGGFVARSTRVSGPVEPHRGHSIDASFSDSTDRANDQYVSERMPDSDNWTGRKPPQGRGVRFRHAQNSDSVAQGKSSSTYSASADASQDGHHLVTTSDLGEGLDAVILERGGRLERVIMNLRQGQPTVATLRRLSGELMRVADSLEEAASASQLSMEGADTTASSVTDLLRHVTEAVWPERGLRRSPSVQASSSASPSPKQRAVVTDSDRSAETVISLQSASARIANRQSIDADYSALRKYFGRGDSYHEEDLADMGSIERLERRATRTLQQTPPGTSPDPFMVRLLTFGAPKHSSTSIPSINVSNESIPMLPSHILKAQDMMAVGTLRASSTELAADSPLMFSPSTCPSLESSRHTSAEPSPVQSAPVNSSVRRTRTWQDLARMTGPAATPVLPVFKPPNPDRDIIRQAMRMHRNKAVQEAAALERQTRRQRQTDARAWRGTF